MVRCELLIVGCGPAGMMAAIYAKRADKDVVVLDRSTPGGRVLSTYQVDNYLGFGRVSAEELVAKMVTHLRDLGIEDRYGKVLSIRQEEQGFRITTDADEYLCDAVIVATGTKSKTLGVTNESAFVGKGLSYCAVCDGIFFKDKDVVVIGGGDSALEESNYLSRIARSVTIVHDLPELTAAAGLAARVRRNPAIAILTETAVTGFVGARLLEGVAIRDRRTGAERVLPAQGAFVYVGNLPETGYLSGTGAVGADGFIAVDRDMKTKVPGLFAAGDVTKKDFRLIATAISDGAIAALSAVKYLDDLRKTEG
ncbi:MAG: FAD-dependent oxidoreductase [Candidatus Izemoplasmatales bacterium]